MTYLFEDDLFKALREYDQINSETKILDDKKTELREKIKKWREINKIDTKLTLTDNGESWILDVIVQNRKSVRDYETLIKRLGDDAEIFIGTTSIESLRITKR
jgi:hypothetical protein